MCLTLLQPRVKQSTVTTVYGPSCIVHMQSKLRRICERWYLSDRTAAKNINGRAVSAHSVSCNWMSPTVSWLNTVINLAILTPL